MMRRLPAPRMVVELFAAGNLAFLAVDVYVAHSVNAFERPQEWIPLALSIAAPLLLVIGWIAGRDRLIGLSVGWASVAVGIAGMLFHLQSHFFEEQTIRNLVYTAPFVAPLAYAGVGLLLILDRMVDTDSLEWAQWVVFLALGGFTGNFVLSLADHAQNGFFNRGEWIPVAASALAVAFLLMMVVRPLDPALLRATALLLALETLVGVLGFALHLRANMARPGESVWARFIYGAPIFAPLLFANLAILAGIGLWAIARPSSRRMSPCDRA
jgi:hypothetical protein